jgi:hypothetical protein
VAKLGERKSATFTYLLILLVVIPIATFFGGWVIGNQGKREEIDKLVVKRLGGYKYISPLLTCDINAKNNPPKLQALENKISQVIEQKKNEKKIDSAAVYFRDLNTAEEINIKRRRNFFQPA